MSVAFELLSVIVRVLTSLRPIALGLNAFAIVGWDITVSEAVLLAGPAAPVSLVPVPPFADDTVPVVFVYAAAVAEVTDTVTVQLAPAASVAPLTPIVVPPAAPPLSTPLGQVVAAFGVAALTKPAGYVSVTASPV